MSEVLILFFCILAVLAGILTFLANYESIMESAVDEEVSRWKKEDEG
jgi:hypothetical protein|tara:strand:+ start:74 stop:214 length:141 start_codon:yes stop_codon:yes gene_type:complete